MSVASSGVNIHVNPSRRFQITLTANADNNEPNPISKKNQSKEAKEKKKHVIGLRVNVESIPACGTL